MGSSGQDAGRADEAAGASPVIIDGRLTRAIAELYGCDPQEFTDRRKALAAAAKSAGDTMAARQIAALRKPTRAAWVVNRLARADPAAPDRLASLAAAMRAAEQARDGPRLRELSAVRGSLIDTMTGEALAAAEVADPPAGLRDEVAATLTAALADPEVAAEFSAGSLTRAAQWAGFGLTLPGGPDADADDTGPLATPPRVRLDRISPAPPQPPADRPTPLAGDRGLLREKEGKEEPAEEGRQRRERLAAEQAAQAADQRRKTFEEAERAVAAAAATAADAVAAEERLEAEVRNLEERLTQARAELADARLRARRAETAERKARQILDRLPRPAVGWDA